jgi:hypothetical protein
MRQNANAPAPAETTPWDIASLMTIHCFASRNILNWSLPALVDSNLVKAQTDSRPPPEKRLKQRAELVSDFGREDL